MADVATIELTVQVMAETEKAYQVYDGDVTDWVPKSLLISKEDAKEKGYFVIEIPEWLAEQKGFV